jgi:hypothetical protein
MQRLENKVSYNFTFVVLARLATSANSGRFRSRYMKTRTCCRRAPRTWFGEYLSAREIFRTTAVQKETAHTYYVQYLPATFTLNFMVLDTNRKKSTHQNSYNKRSFPDPYCSLMLSVNVKFPFIHSPSACLFIFLLRYKRRPSFLCYLTTPYQLQATFSSKQNTSVLMVWIEIQGSPMVRV